MGCRIMMMPTSVTMRRTTSLPRLLGNNRLFYLFLLPMFLLVTVFGILPIIKSIQMSFTESGTSLSFDPVYVGFQNYLTIFQDSYFIDSLKITLWFTAVSVPLNVAVAFLLSLLFASPYLKRGRLFFKLAVFMPVVAPIMATSVVWKWLYNSDFGAVNAILNMLHLPSFGGISDVNTVLWALVIVELWKHVGLYTVVFLTNLQMIDVTMYEAAHLEGANYLQTYLVYYDSGVKTSHHPQSCVCDHSIFKNLCGGPGYDPGGAKLYIEFCLLLCLFKIQTGLLWRSCGYGNRFISDCDCRVVCGVLAEYSRKRMDNINVPRNSSFAGREAGASRYIFKGGLVCTKKIA